MITATPVPSRIACLHPGCDRLALVLGEPCCPDCPGGHDEDCDFFAAVFAVSVASNEET